MKMTGAQIFIESLKREGVEVLFGYPGGSLLPIFDHLYDEKKIRFILVRHEQGAAHMADGYARVTGKVGVCIATSGPGATNLVTGIATAYMDSVPMVAFTGQVKTNLIGNDAFQEADLTGITRPITKHNYLVKDVRDLARTIQEAFYIASTGRPGPVLIDLPSDVQQAQAEFQYPPRPHIRGYNPTYKGHPGQIKRAAKAVSDSKRPVIYAGGGVIIAGAHQELRAFAEKIDAPVTTTLMGMGAFPGTHRLFVGMLGMHGTVCANHAVMESDLIIAIGARFDDRVTGKLDTFAPHAKIIHIDIDPASVSKNVPVDIPIVGDAKEVLVDLTRSVKKPDTAAWMAQISEWLSSYPLSYARDDKLRAQYVIEQIWEMTKGEAIITTEVGQHQMWAAQYYKFDHPRTFVTSGGLGTMGYGLPATIGAKLGRPDKVVIGIAGDGSFQMNIQELATAVVNKVPVKIAILNNCCLGMVRQWQELFYAKRYSNTCFGGGSPDFVMIARAYGADGIKVTRKEDVRAAIEQALAADTPFIMEFAIEQEENVFPMVPAGEAINRMIGGMA